MFTGTEKNLGSSKPDSIRPLIQWGSVLLVGGVYIISFPWLHQKLGWSAISFIWIVLGLSIWFWGLKGAVLAHIAAFILNVALLKSIGAELASKLIPRHAILATTQRYLCRISKLEAIKWIDNLHG